MYNPFSLEGKTVLVTGASSGIGRSIAIECSRMGANVVLTARNETRLKEEDINKIVTEMPMLNGVVNNAGVGNRVLCKAIKESNLNEVILPNLYGPILLQRHLLKKKRIAKEASIVMIASRAPFAPSIGNAVYAASKGAILGYANVLALECAPQKVRVNSICPAMVWTELIEKDAALMGADYEDLQQKYPLKRYGKPEDVAYLSIYLLSDASSWMTGSAIDLTGGAKGL